jgi:hypothetical protein
MVYESLPNTWVIEEARAYLRAAQILERSANEGDISLFWPAAMNTGLALELYLKAFLVESDPDHPADMDDPEGYLKLVSGLPRNKHDLYGLYEAIPVQMANRLRLISERLAPGYPLQKWIKECSALFVQARYAYEAKSLQAFDTDVFKLAPHLDRVLQEMVNALLNEAAQTAAPHDP